MPATGGSAIALWILACSASLSLAQLINVEDRDVVEGESLRLSCHFNPSLATKNILYYWIRTNRYGKDNAAISGTALDLHYSVDFHPKEGRYDLLISRAEYNKDNGQFECKLKEGGSGADLHNMGYAVTVLIPPGEPKVNPTNPVAREGEPVTITCSSEGGSPDPTIQWYRENKPIQSKLQKGGTKDKPTIAVLVINPSRNDDGVEYRCVVYNRALPDNQKLDAKVSLRVHYAPKITVGPSNPLNVMVGSDAILTCSAIANPPVRSIRWVKRNQLLSNTYNHTIPSVTPEDSGEYSCVADNGVGQPSKEDLKLSVLYGPRVSVVPEHEASQGETVVIKCNVASNPTPHTIFWRKEGDPYFRQSGDTLRLERVAAEDTGRYICEAEVYMRPSSSAIQTEVIGNDSVSINIKHKPGDAEVVPSNPTAVAGRLFILSCVARPPGWPAPTYRWWRDGKEHIELSNTVNYTILAVHSSHEGRYYCQPSNSLGKGTIASVYLSVNEAATIVIPLRPQLIRKIGDSGLAITCRSRGKPKPRVQWLYKGLEIPKENPNFKISTVESIEDNNAFSVQSTLAFEGTLSPEHRGKYACSFDNGFGGAAKSEMILRIEHPPQVHHTYNRVAFDVGETAVIQCKMQAYPEPTYEWVFKGRILDKYANYATNVTDLGDDIYAGVLTVGNVKDDDYGDYTCRAWNQVGNDMKTLIRLVKKSAPDRPTHLQVVDVNSDQITLQWNEGFNGGFVNTEFIVTYTNTGTGQTRNESCRTQNPCPITGLDSKSEYVFKVVAVNPRGFSPYSEELSVLTKVNLRDMPRPMAAQYDKETNTVYFNVESSVLKLIAKIEGRTSGQQDFMVVTAVEVDRPQISVSLPNPPLEGFTDVKITLCLQSNVSWCGDGKLAEPFDAENSARAVGAPASISTMNLVIIVAVATGVFFLLVIVLVCCCWKRKGKKGKKDYEAEIPTVRPKVISPPYYHDGGVNKNIDNNSDDINKHNMNSNINSYHMMNGMNNINGMNGHVGNLSSNGILYGPSDMMDGNNDSQSDLWVKSGVEVPPEASYQPYDSRLPNGYYYPEDYQPLSEDMMNMKNREHLHAPYYDVSGLPDPYAMGDDDKTQQISFDESLESGYSTPNSRSRRVVREIIV